MRRRIGPRRDVRHLGASAGHGRPPRPRDGHTGRSAARCRSVRGPTGRAVLAPRASQTPGTTPAGGVTVDVQGHLDFPMRATIGADGKAHVECAAPALGGTKRAMARAGLVATGALFAALVTGRAQGDGIVVDNFDVPGTGLNDEDTHRARWRQPGNDPRPAAAERPSVRCRHLGASSRATSPFSSRRASAPSAAGAVARRWGGRDDCPSPGLRRRARAGDVLRRGPCRQARLDRPRPGAARRARRSTAPSTTGAAASGASGTMASTLVLLVGLQVRPRLRRPARAGARARASSRRSTLRPVRSSTASMMPSCGSWRTTPPASSTRP